MSNLPQDLNHIFNYIKNMGLSLPMLMRSFKCFYYNSGPVHVVLGSDTMKMDIIQWIPGQGIRSVIANASPKFDIAISGAFYDFDPFSFLKVGQLLGEIVQSGRIIESGDIGDYAYIAYMDSGEYHFGVSQHVPTSGVKWGLGGLVPIIIGGRLESSNPWFKKHNEKTGRCMIGHSNNNNMLLIIAQNSTNPMYDLNDFQNFYHSFGCENVVGLDGSTSAMLWHDNSWKFTNTQVKDMANRTAIGFRL